MLSAVVRHLRLGFITADIRLTWETFQEHPSSSDHIKTPV